VGALLDDGRRRLARVAEQPGLEASLLLASVLKRPRAWIVAHPEAPVSPHHDLTYRRAVEQVVRGIALPYVLGRWEFFGRTFEVTPDVLIPRPETELLIDHALEYAGRRPGPLRGIDVGTGSGCIAVTLAIRLPDSRWQATDIEACALEVARRNARRHGLSDRIQFVRADLAGPVAGRFDLVCANLPYVPTARLATLEAARREPRRALDGGDLGLDLLLRLIDDLPRLMAPSGRALLEIDHTHVEPVLQAVHRLDGRADAAVYADLAGQPRLLQVDRRG
jgi:release factor glutamine methyltransferase